MIFSIALVVMAADPGWKEVVRQAGFLVERREVGNERYYEYRVTTDTDVSVGALCDGVYEWGSVGTDHEHLKNRHLLEDHGDWRVTYDTIVTPAPVATRDVAFTMKREKKADGTCDVDFFSTNEKAPPLPKGWVRLAKLKGRWHLEPRPGGTHITYTLYTDPGGSVPAGLVHSSQRDAALSTVKKGIRVSREGATGALRD